MRTLDDAWRWYVATRQNLERMNRLARKYWAVLPWEGALGQDDEFRTLESSDVETETRGSVAFIDDLAVVVLFPVFEQAVRGQVGEQVRSEVATLSHPVMLRAAEDALRAVEEGSFFRVLEPYKTEGHADLIEEVNQVRRYRNWVAHGRRGDQPPSVTPVAAYDRLSRFLAIVFPVSEADSSPSAGIPEIGE
jgi:hypothetical protein